MNYSRARGARQRIYEPSNWADEQEELRLIRQQEAERAAAKAPAPAAPPTTTDSPATPART
jgi:hypothetical protein